MVGILGLLLLSGCANQQTEDRRTMPAPARNWSQWRESLEQWMKASPCGVLTVRSPLFNVTGHFTGNVTPNTSVYLYVTPNTSFNASYYVVGNCRYIAKRKLHNARFFDLGPLPQGDYVVMVDGRAFQDGQGFPVLDRLDDSSYVLETAFTGGSPLYSMTAFSIRLKQPMASAADPRPEGANG